MNVTSRMFRRGMMMAGAAGVMSFAAYTKAHAAGSGLDSKDFKPFQVKEVVDATHDSKLIKFSIPDQQAIKACSFVLVRDPALNDDENKPVVRPYTPVHQTDGEITLLIKGYSSGKLSKKMVSLKKGDSVELKGPITKLPYSPNSKQEIALVAGGTGVTPMLQLIKAILDNPNDKTKVTLVFANHEEKDILLREELDKLAKKHSNFNLHYVLSKPSSEWKGDHGRINKDLLEKYLPSSKHSNILIGVCGPPGFYKDISGTKTKDFKQGEVEGYLKQLGYNSDQVFKF